MSGEFGYGLSGIEMADSGNNITDEQLMAFADGELDAEEIGIVEAAIQAQPSLQNKVDDYKKSASILKSGFSVEGMEIPEEILSQIDALEKNENRKPEDQKIGFFLENIISFFQLQYALPTAAAFALGIFLGPTVLGPGPFPPNGDLMGPSSGVSTDQIVIRGSNVENDGQPIPGSDIASLLQVQILQNGVTVLNNGTLEEGQPFVLTLLSPLDGSVTLQEVIDGSVGEIIDTQEAVSGLYVTFPAMQVDDQEDLSLRVTIADSEIQIAYTLNFSVEN